MPKRYALIIFYTTVVAMTLFWDYNRDFDSTDDAENRVRSGMTLYTDHLTGCQYLQAGWFGFDSLVPRYNSSGGQVGCNK